MRPKPTVSEPDTRKPLQELARLLKTEREIIALDRRSYLTLLAMAIGLRDRGITTAKVTKGY